MIGISKDFSWIGRQESYIDTPDCFSLDDIVIGRFGGNSKAGQNKNEDGCLVWSDSSGNWEFVMILDAHSSSESAELILKEFEKNKGAIKDILAGQVNVQITKRLEELVLSLFQSNEFLLACQKVKGETACLIVARIDKYVWWFSVGDCLLFLFHPELAAFGQYQLNQRQFYEWIGQVNTFEKAVPCYSSGTRELRKGINHLFLTTDGLVECPNDPFSNPSDIFKAVYNTQDEDVVLQLLRKIQENGVRDSTTIVSWKINSIEEASLPTK